ncbi:hypothetical protein QOZ80_1BG0058800 [Eleusine coracana subsp. coracana]|nr:hypothetical protein QOZ80_1BG0058800 [Eleusine coracana subsp. coracana]
MSGDTTPPQVVEDFCGVVQLLSDGSVVRGDESGLTPVQTIPELPGVQWKDVVYDATRGLKVRVYRPPLATGEEGNKKLPVLVYFHGGGYCVGAYDQPRFHSCCRRFAAELPALVLSVQYRLAPEHRLPAAIEDGETFLSWLRQQAELGGNASAESWLAESADFARTEERVETETDPPAGVPFTVEISDQLWRMALPVGATRDHPLTNPFGPDSPSLEPVALPPVLVVAPGGDILNGHVRRYAAKLKEMGKAVELVEFSDQGHAFSVTHWGEANLELIRILKRFVSQN